VLGEEGLIHERVAVVPLAPATAVGAAFAAAAAENDPNDSQQRDHSSANVDVQHVAVRLVPDAPGLPKLKGTKWHSNCTYHSHHNIKPGDTHTHTHTIADR